MQLREVQRLFQYLARQPPVHELVAGYMGLQDPGPGTATAAVTAEDKARLDELTRKWGLS